MKATTIRVEHGETETLGVLLLDGEIFCYTLELPWRRNVPTISSIPPGTYDCERYRSEDHGSVFRVSSVPGRTGIILGHVGNTHHDTTGCILLGKYPGQLTNPGARAVTNSAQTCAAFQARTHLLDRIELEIIEVRT